MDEGTFVYFLDKLRATHGEDIHRSALQIRANIPSINWLSVDLVARVLRFTPTNDTLAVMLVCKRWYEASRKPDFWRERIANRLRGLIPLFASVSFTEETRRLTRDAAIKHFDPFFMQDIPFRDRLAWIFDRSKFDVLGEKNKREKPGFYWIVTKSANSSLRESDLMGILFHADSYRPHEYFTGNYIIEKVGRLKATKRPNSRYFVVSVDPVVNLRSREVVFGPDGCLDYTKITFRTDQGHLFEGSCDLRTNVPHGAGKWTFLDGSTLTGDNVAFQGQPHGKGQDGEDEYFAGERLVVTKKRRLEELEKE